MLWFTVPDQSVTRPLWGREGCLTLWGRNDVLVWEEYYRPQLPAVEMVHKTTIWPEVPQPHCSELPVTRQ